MDSPLIDLRPVHELLADAERYERWADRTKAHPNISERFAGLAKKAREKAGG